MSSSSDRVGACKEKGPMRNPGMLKRSIDKFAIQSDIVLSSVRYTRVFQCVGAGHVHN